MLRDSLFSQQDHPLENDPYAPLLPPGWVTAAVADVSAGVALRPMCTPGVDEDEKWKQVVENMSKPPPDSSIQVAEIRAVAAERLEQMKQKLGLKE